MASNSSEKKNRSLRRHKNPDPLKPKAPKRRQISCKRLSRKAWAVENRKKAK